MFQDEKGNQIKAANQQATPRMKTVRDSGSMTRSKISQYELIDTIVCQNFGDDIIYHEEEVTYIMISFISFLHNQILIWEW